MWPKKKSKNQRDRDGLESIEAIHLARKELHEIKSREPVVENIAKDMLHIRQRNHFTEQLNKVILKPHKSGG